MKIINRNETFLVLCTYCGLKAVEMQDLIVAQLRGHLMDKVTFERVPSYWYGDKSNESFFGCYLV